MRVTATKAVKACCVMASILPLVAYITMITTLSLSPARRKLRKEETKNEGNMQFRTEDRAAMCRPATMSKPPARGWMKNYHWTPIPQGVYDFLINPVEKCKQGNGNITLLILIKSASSHASQRAIIRETYVRCAQENNVSARVLFVLGTPVNDIYREGIKREADQHGDILQADFIDNYYNLTIKLIMSFKWAITFCSNSEFVMSTDDDAILDVYTIVQDLRALPLEYRSNLCLGDPLIGTSPVRDVRSKYYVPKEMYPEDIYPVYPSGPGYVLSQDVVRKLYDASKTLLPKTAIDDVYCGSLLKVRGIGVLNMMELYPILHPERQGLKDLKNNYFYLMAQLSIGEMKKTWNYYKNYCIRTELVHDTPSSKTLILIKNPIKRIVDTS